MTNSTHATSRSTIEIITGLLKHLGRSRRYDLLCLFLVMIISGTAELFSLASVVPFLAVITNPESVWKYQFTQQVTVALGISSPPVFALFITLIFCLATIFSTVIRLQNLSLNSHIAAKIGTDLSTRAFSKLLYAPYIEHTSGHTSNIVDTATTQTARTVVVINNLLQMLTSIIVSAGVLIVLFLTSWKVALCASTILCSLYIIIGALNQKKLSSISIDITLKSRAHQKLLHESLGGIRDVILDDLQPRFINKYQGLDSSMRLLDAESIYLAGFPRYFIEASSLIIFAISAVVLNSTYSTTSSTVAVLGTLALGAQRLIPSLQQIYNGWAVIKAYKSSCENVLKALDLKTINPTLLPSNSLSILASDIVFKDISYSSKGRSVIFSKLNLVINEGDRVGITGPSGSGKSTFLDIAMGLISPTEGSINVGGVDINCDKCTEYARAWRSCIAHVPQNIFLLDSSIADNIALGDPNGAVDTERVVEAAKQARISSFIESLPESYLTCVGERGVRLSGGQRQRIGIARALYKKSRVIVLDEATSALDMKTEAEVMTSLSKLDRNVTVLMVAHRLSTLEFCDYIIEIKDTSINIVSNV
jgi:ABC-type bacteriocin/lantibiotic exporter with double-glycine peptidase domain